MSEPLSWEDIPGLMGDLRDGPALLSREGRAQSVTPSDLVQSALMRQVPGGTKTRDQVNWSEVTWENRETLFKYVKRSMIHVLIDHAKLRNTRKRQAIKTVLAEDLQIEDWVQLADEQQEIFQALSHALDKLAEEHPDWAEAITTRYLAKLTVKETAAWMEKSDKTIRTWIDRARLILKEEIERRSWRRTLDETYEGPHGKPVGQSRGPLWATQAIPKGPPGRSLAPAAPEGEDPSVVRGVELWLCERPESDRDRRGEVIGPYRLVERLGEGGIGDVYLARKTVLSDGSGNDGVGDVAVKIIRWPPGARPEEISLRTEQLRRETQILANLNHPYLCYIEAADIERGRHDEAPLCYFAMRLVPCGMWITKFARERALDVGGILNLMVKVCGAVQYAHERGVIHGDLKPQNILVDRHEVPHVLDFGLAKIVVEAVPRPGGTIRSGTPQYMSPEHVTGVEADFTYASDVYALGIVLYELLRTACRMLCRRVRWWVKNGRSRSAERFWIRCQRHSVASTGLAASGSSGPWPRPWRRI